MARKLKGVVKDAAYFARIGRLGGLKTKERKLTENPNYYSDIGTLAGNKIVAERGKEYYSMLGKMPSKTNRQRGRVKHVAI